MDTWPKTNGTSRIEIRVSTGEKELFEYASHLKGFKSFSEYLRVTLTRESKAIIAEKIEFSNQKGTKKFFLTP